MDLFCLNDFEYTQAISQQRNDFAPKQLLVTHGAKGCTFSQAESSLRLEVPSFAIDVVDPIGCGDALMALAAPLLSCGTDPEVSCFVGSCAAALQCEVEVNSKPIHPFVLRNFVRRLLS
jgi:sugar/nucleoside kinase (ribokinase family)